MCYALIQTSFRGKKGTPQLTTVETPEQLVPKIKEAQSKPEAIKVHVFLYQDYLSTQRVEEWKSKKVLQNEANHTIKAVIGEPQDA